MESSSKVLAFISTILGIAFLSRSAADTLFTIHRGYSLWHPCIQLQKADFLVRCLARCSLVPACISGFYTEANGACCLSDRLLYQDGALFVADAGSTYFQTRAEVARHGNWTLVFRGSQGIGDSIHHELLDTSRHDDHPVGRATAALSCWSLFGSHSCSKHLRSALLNSWAAGTLAVQKVKVSLYKNEAEVVFIEFDGTGTNLTSWFTPSRITSSSYPDVTSSQTFLDFMFHWYVADFFDRSFYVSYDRSSCETDIGWLEIIDYGHCAWAKPDSPYPHFMYSPLSTKMMWGEDLDAVGYADVLAIFVTV